MHIAFALFADAANLSQEGKLNILGVFDALHVGQLPVVHPRAALVLLLKGDGADVGDHQVGLSWRNPNGDELWSSQASMHVGPPSPGVFELDLPLLAQVDLPVDQPGSYAMEVSIDGRHVFDVPMQVRSAIPRMTGSGGLVS